MMLLALVQKIQAKLVRIIKHIIVLYKTRKPLYQLYLQNCCISPEEIQIYGQYTDKSGFSLLILRNGIPLSAEKVQLLYCEKRPDFIIKIKGSRYEPEDRYTFIIDGKILYKMIQLQDPLVGKMNPAQCVISTMVKNEEKRIVEWINYNFLLGFEKIIIFLNNSTDGTVEAIKKLANENVIVIPFNYVALPGWHWNTVQRIQLSISSNCLRKFAKWVCFIDIDEFIYICDHASRCRPFIQTYIDDFCHRHRNASALKINSYFFTNEQNVHYINQDVIANCQLRGKTLGYTKVIVNSELLSEFTITPHEFNAAISEPSSSIYIGHYWLKESVSVHERPDYFPKEFYECREIVDFVSEEMFGKNELKRSH